MKLEELPESQRREIHLVYENRGLAIPDGAEVEPTDWAYENGVFRKPPKRRNIKIRNARTPGNIAIETLGCATLQFYWAGFWKERESVAALEDKLNQK